MADKPGPLLYKPTPRWQVLAALGAAIGIHALAAVIAGIHKEVPPMDVSNIPEAVAEVTFEQASPEPTPPPEMEEPEPTEAPPEPTEVPEFVEEKPTPQPKRDKPPKPVAPIARPRSAAPTGTTSMSSAKASAIFGPKPEYPYEARRSKLTGSGVCIMTVDVSSGTVTGAEMAQSTGSPILDNAAMSAFRRWRFRPNSVPPRVKVPVTFTMTGAQF